VGNKNTIDQYLEEILHWDEITREEAAKKLGDLGNEKAIKPLLQVLQEDDSANVREATAKALSNFCHIEHIAKDIADTMKEEPSPIVRLAMANTIGEFESKDIGKILLNLLEGEKSHWVREAIVEALGKTNNRIFTSKLIEILENDPSKEVRIQAAKSLSRLGDKRMKQQLLHCFNTEKDDEVRSFVAETLTMFPEKEVIEVLIEALEDSEKLTRVAVSEALYEIAKELGYKNENELIDSF
jgi:HEAT repeat protein